LTPDRYFFAIPVFLSFATLLCFILIFICLGLYTFYNFFFYFCSSLF
jgi:hypothetical protein